MTVTVSRPLPTGFVYFALTPSATEVSRRPEFDVLSHPDDVEVSCMKPHPVDGSYEPESPVPSREESPKLPPPSKRIMTPIIAASVPRPPPDALVVP